MAEDENTGKDTEDADEKDFWAEIVPHYQVDVVTPDVFERAGEGGEDDLWADNHCVSLLANDKAECRRLARRMLELWHIEDPSVTQVNICITRLHGDFYIEESIRLPEGEL